MKVKTYHLTYLMYKQHNSIVIIKEFVDDFHRVLYKQNKIKVLSDVYIYSLNNMYGSYGSDTTSALIDFRFINDKHYIDLIADYYHIIAAIRNYRITNIIK